METLIMTTEQIFVGIVLPVIALLISDAWYRHYHKDSDKAS
jgi:hypothetical protein